MTKSELIEQVSANYPDMTRNQVEFIVNTLFDSIKKALAKGEKVEIRGFGSFNVRRRKARTGHNPRDGSAIKIPAKNLLSFRTSKDIKEALVKL